MRGPGSGHQSDKVSDEPAMVDQLPRVHSSAAVITGLAERSANSERSDSQGAKSDAATETPVLREVVRRPTRGPPAEHAELGGGGDTSW